MRKSRRTVAYAKKEQRTFLTAVIVGSWIVTVGNLVVMGMYLLRK